MQFDLGGLERHVVGRDVGGDRDLDAHLALGDRRALAEGDRLLEHLDIELEPDRRDMAGLLVAEQVARTPDLQVPHGDAQPAAELRVVGQGAQPGGGIAAERGLVRVAQVRLRGHLAAADPATDLVELRESELVGALNDEGVGLRDVEPRLDDAGGDQDVGLPADEREHHVLELVFGHAAVGHEHRELRHAARTRSAAFSMVSTRLCRKKLWPSRSCSRRSASWTCVS